MTVHQINGEENLRRRNPAPNINTASSTSSMSLTYSDFLYPQPLTGTGEDDVDVVGTLAENLNHHRGNLGSSASVWSPVLPSEFQVIQDSAVPLLQNLEEADHDFIIIAEFSELEGPIPICTIPSNGPEKTDINLNSFAVHLMSTDYQVNTVGQFGICEDTQVLRTNVFKGVHVFMQYFTLYDIKARGFVRPFCFGYVSKDNIKLDRIVKFLIDQFNEITQVLKHTNRVWFAYELTEYLKKLCKAKEEFIFRTSPPVVINGETEDVLGEAGIMLDNGEHEDSEVISLNQIAQQYTEIESILKTIKDALAYSSSTEAVNRFQLEHSLPLPDDSLLSILFKKFNCLGNTFLDLDIPLVHPLKQKGESLRPLTSLCQLGTITLVRQLMATYQEHYQDLIFMEFGSLTEDFRTHFLLTKPNSLTEGSIRSPKAHTFDNIVTDEEELCQVLEKIHTSVPIVAGNSASGSYHSLSTEESELATTPCQVNDDGCSYKTSVGSVESIPSKYFKSSKHMADTPASTSTSSFSTTPGRFNGSPKSPQRNEFFCHSDMNSSWTIVEPRRSIDSQSGEDVTRLLLPPPVENEAPFEIQKVPWWTYASKTKLQKGDPGYGLRKFWIHFYKEAHHLFFSILIGRPIIFYGSSKFRTKINQIINALMPFIPSFPAESFKVLYWHQGILVQNHLNGSHKLIGLCIPERHSIHDLVNPRDQNSVTLLDVERKRTNPFHGPAYSGNYFKSFEKQSTQKRFFNDLSLMTFIGSILMELETQVYMCKAMQIDDKMAIPKIMGNLELRNSDTDIVKYLASCIEEPEQVVNLF